MFYSRSTGGFYDSEIHGAAIPVDAVEITVAEHARLLEGQAEGFLIVTDDDGVPALQAPPEETSVERFARDIAGRRYQAETAGITVNGTQIPTDRDSQGLITGAALAAVLDPNYTCRWKTIEGFITLGASQIIAMATAVRTHVQACFDREAELLVTLEAGEYTAAMLNEGWPA